MKTLKIVMALAVHGVAGGLAFIYSGAFDAAADIPHTKPMYWLMQTVRERAIAVRSKDIEAMEQLKKPITTKRIPTLQTPRTITTEAGRSHR